MARKTSSILRQLKKKLRKKPRTQAEKDKYLKGQAKKMDSAPTKPEILFAKLLDELEIEYRTQEIVGGKIYDFYIPSKNTLIEVDGTYWHGYDLLQEEMSRTQKKIVRNDKYKDALAHGHGYEILRVWEHELDDEYEKTKEKFKYLLL